MPAPNLIPVDEFDPDDIKPDITGVNLDGLAWRKSSRSNGAGGMCVQVASYGGGVLLRDSKNPDVALAFSRNEAAVFLASVQDGEFDDIT
ncbi:DUF397 domain-containing protein [Frankia sp. AiPs1]|uniref:DUF397 domain-containing protein n=1 Tax=Frankia sp. AiPa1 TaxID=573492 RepID=UPI002551DEAA|nr:DUF397 domain-containing protein [Frankia sp. AiPa1]